MREMSGTENGGSGSNPSLSSVLTPENPPALVAGEGGESPQLPPHYHGPGAESPPPAQGEPAARPHCRCTEPETDAEGRAHPCAAVVGAHLQPGQPGECSVCHGSRCYFHCGSVDHMGGRLYVAAGSAGGFTFRVRQILDAPEGEFQMGRFAGHIVSVRTGRVIVRDIESDDPEEVVRECSALIDRQRTPAAPTFEHGDGCQCRRCIPAPIPPPSPALLADCRRRADDQRAVVVAGQILAKANACPCAGCKAIVRLFNLIVMPAAQAAGKVVR
jgi:hypothetical protein